MVFRDANRFPVGGTRTNQLNPFNCFVTCPLPGIPSGPWEVRYDLASVIGSVTDPTIPITALGPVLGGSPGQNYLWILPIPDNPPFFTDDMTRTGRNARIKQTQPCQAVYANGRNVQPDATTRTLHGRRFQGSTPLSLVWCDSGLNRGTLRDKPRTPVDGDNPRTYFDNASSTLVHEVFHFYGIDCECWKRARRVGPSRTDHLQSKTTIFEDLMVASSRLMVSQHCLRSLVATLLMFRTETLSSLKRLLLSLMPTHILLY